jgi:dihydrofolate reductase
MRKLNAFTFLTLNGFYKGPAEDTHWHAHGEEEARFSEDQLKTGNILLFGRKTYDMMYSFWPTPMASQLFPKVAEGMNRAEKLVISRTLRKPEWKNTTALSENVVGELRKLKATPGKNLTLLGSGSILTLLTDANLVDEYQIMIDPVVLGQGSSLFEGLKNQLTLKLAGTRVFQKSGVVLLTYVRSR